MLPLLSVCIRTRNRVNYLREAVQSVLEQTFTEWELLISDDDSSDGTVDYCETLRNDPRIRICRHVPGLGAAGNWRFCLQQSRGTYFVALDDDNRFLPTFLESCVAALRQFPDATYAFSDEWRIDSDGNRNLVETDRDSDYYGRLDLVSGYYPRTVMIGLRRSAGINAALIHRERLIQAGGFRELAGDSAGFDLFLNLAAQGHSCVYIQERLVEYRRHGAQEGDTYLYNIPIAQNSVNILESVSFEGDEERLRRQELALSYSALSRVYLINRQYANGRRAIRNAWKLNPGRKKTLVALLVAHMPGLLIKFLMSRIYGRA